MPYPWQTRILVRAVKRRGRSGARGAAPDLTHRTLCSRGNAPASAAWQIALIAGGTSGIMVIDSWLIRCDICCTLKRGIRIRVAPRMSDGFRITDPEFSI